MSGGGGVTPHGPAGSAPDVAFERDATFDALNNRCVELEAANASLVAELADTRAERDRACDALEKWMRHGEHDCASAAVAAEARAEKADAFLALMETPEWWREEVDVNGEYTTTRARGYYECVDEIRAARAALAAVVDARPPDDYEQAADATFGPAVVEAPDTNQSGAGEAAIVRDCIRLIVNRTEKSDYVDECTRQALAAIGVLEQRAALAGRDKAGGTQ